MPKAGVQIKMTGVKELAKALDDMQMPEKLVPVLASAVNFAMTPVLRMAKATAPRESHATVAALMKKSKGYRRWVAAWAGVAPRSDFFIIWKGRRRKPSKYSHLIQGKGGNPYLQRAIEANRGSIHTRFAKKAWQKIGKLVEQANTRAG